MDGRGNGAGVDCPVEHLPAAAAEAPDHGLGRGRRERREQDKGEHAQENEGAPEQVGDNQRQVEFLVKPGVREGMETAIEESKESRHPSDLHDARLAAYRDQWSDGQGPDEKDQRQHSGRPDQVFLRIGPETIVERVPPEQQGGQRRIDKEDQSRKRGGIGSMAGGDHQ